MRIGILTGGGDCPALNAVIRAAVKTCVGFGWEVIGIEEGFEGLVHLKTLPLRAGNVSGILHLGGTILGTTNAANPFCYPVRGEDGQTVERLSKKGIPLVGVPKTIDNDINGTVVTFGFDTAVNTAREALDRLHTTAESHRRVIVVEVMGRYAGWIALHSGIAGGADVILIPEIPYDTAKVADAVMRREISGKRFIIVVVAEGAFPKGGTLTHIEPKKPGREQRLGGVGERVASAVSELTGKETRLVVLGHLQRGGAPTTFDRVLGTRFGAAAARLVRKGAFGRMVALIPPDVESVPIAEAISRVKTVPVDCDTVESAREIGISFGD